MTRSFRYFAYGSNMLTRRLKAPHRAPSARPVGTGYLRGRRLTFDKVGRDGSGKCDAQPTGRDGDRVYGVIYEISTAERKALDETEGAGYEAQTVDVETPSGAVEAITYIARQKDPAVRPYHWYRAITLAGAIEHGLPVEYVARLRAVASVEDRNAERRAQHEALLRALGACRRV
jgi:cation transport regulator ChaC